MSEPFIGEIRMFGFNFPPRSWAQCDGALLAIAQFQSLFSILGTTYGGDGRTTFALPELRGRTPIGFGQGAGLPFYSLGARSGEESHTITAAEMPPHSHTLMGTHTNATADHAEGAFPAISEVPAYGNVGVVNMSAAALSTAPGSGQAHYNMQPYQVINFCIALSGIFPPRN